MASPLLRRHTTLAPGAHAFCEGLAHRQTSKRIALRSYRHETNVHLLSNPSADYCLEGGERCEALLTAVTEAFRA